MAMSASMRRRARRVLDEELGAVQVPSRPPAGWLRAIRDAVGMSTTELARRLNMSPQGVSDLERSEAEEGIRLSSLRKVADALGCDLEYVLVPRHPGGLQGQVTDQALRVARAELAPVRHTMALEAQALPADLEEEAIADLAERIADSRALWVVPRR